jgi:hypothetical protein
MPPFMRQIFGFVKVTIATKKPHAKAIGAGQD